MNEITICNLQPGIVKKVLIGLVIAKYQEKTFADRKNPGQTTSHLLFTIRDSLMDYINVICRGSKGYIERIKALFNTGDFIQIENAMVRSKQNGEYESKYHPSTPGLNQIYLSETHSKIMLARDDDHDLYALLCQPIRESNDYFTLQDILANSHDLNGSVLNILAAVRNVGSNVNVRSKTGETLVKKELVLFDHSCPYFPFIIWDEEIGKQTGECTALNTILFLVDVKVYLDTYRKKMVISATSKTIITVNPDIPPAHELYSYAQNVQFDQDLDMNMQPETFTIQDEYTLLELEEKLLVNEDMNDLIFTPPFYGFTFAVVSKFDLDKNKDFCILSKCSNCKKRIMRDSTHCSNSSCAGSSTSEKSSNKIECLEVRMNVSDHTNGFEGFLMTGEVAERVLNCNVELFRSMSEVNKTSLKWKYLFERFKIYFKASPAGQERRYPLVQVVDIIPAL